jgi:hypothetical protein
VFALGAATVTVTARDANGNTATATFIVTVRDTTAPVIAVADVVAEATSTAGAVVTFAATATDLFGPVTITYSKPSGSTFALGVNTVTVTARDANANTSTAIFTVTVRDTTAPVITVPNVVAEATSAAGAAVTFAATATDLFGPVTVSYDRASGSTFALGATPVTVTARDANGNTSTATFTVTVRDTTAPTFTFVSPNIVAIAEGSRGRAVTYRPASATDLFGPVTITYSKASGTIFPIGTTVVIVTAADAHGNVQTASFTVTVLRVRDCRRNQREDGDHDSDREQRSDCRPSRRMASTIPTSRPRALSPNGALAVLVAPDRRRP